MSELRTQADLAKRMGITRQSVNELIRSGDWPVAMRGPWTEEDFQRIQSWRGQGQAARDERMHNEADVNRALKLVKIQLTKTQNEIARMNRDVKSGQLVPRDQLDQSLGALAAEFVSVISEMEAAGVQRFQSMSQREFENYLDNARRRIIDRGRLELKSMERMVLERNNGSR